MLIGSWSQVNKFPCAQYPIIISYNSIVVRPPSEKTEDLIVPFGLRKIFLPKKRFVSLHSQKHFQRMVYFFILFTAWVFESEALFCEGCNPVFL